MSSGSDSPEADLNSFTAPNEKFDKNTVLNNTSGTTIDTQSPTITWEQYGRKLPELVAFRGSIDVGSVRNMAKQWSDHGKNLTTLAAKFSNEVKANIKDSWDSDGGAAASKAVQSYADQLSQLPVVINGIAHSLGLSADFLDETQKNIPDEKGLLIDGKTDVISKFTYKETVYTKDASHTETKTATGDDYAQHYDTYSDDTHVLVRQQILNRAHEVMNNVFVPGGSSVDNAMPIFPLPQPVTQGLPDPTGKPTGTPTGTPTGSPSGITPGLTNFSTAALQKQDAAQQADYAKQQAAELKQQQQQAAQAQQQQEEQQASQAAQQGMQAAQQAVQQGLQAAQQAAQQLTQPAAADAMKDFANAAGLAGMADSALAGLGTGGGGGGGLGAALNSTKGSILAAEEQASKLFPRAAMAAKAEEAAVEEARAGLATGSGGMGPMGGMGAAGRGQQEKDKEKKRAEFLDSEEWLEQAMGEAPVTSKPVVDG